jgi:hypothetical protein
MANDVLCETPNMQHSQKMTPQQVFSKTNVLPNPKHWKPFGCPTYVLDNTLQSGTGIFHKWKQQSRVGIYIGRWPQHARSVALVLDWRTGLVSPQFHIKLDPSSQTVKSDDLNSLWQLKMGFVVRSPKVTISQPVVPKRPTIARRNVEQMIAPSEGAPSQKRQKMGQQEIDQRPTREINGQLQRHEESPEMDQGKEPERFLEHEEKRDRTPATKMTTGQKTTNSNDSRNKDANSQRNRSEIFCLEAMFSVRITDDEHPLMADKATSDPDTMYLHQAMKEADHKEFITAMKKEVQDQSDNGNFSIVHKSTVPEGAKILPTVWQMKRKRDIKTRVVKKWKA